MSSSGRLAARLWMGRSTKAIAIVAGVAAIAAGCNQLPGDGPLMGGAHAGSTEILPYDIVELTPATIGAYRPAVAVDRPSTTMHRLPFGGRLTVAPGDVLRVRIFEGQQGGIFSTPAGEGTDLGLKRVNDDGIITLPFVGAVRVADLETAEIERRILAQLGNRARNPHVVVEFAADRSNTVSVSGDVKEPGQIGLIEGVRTVVEAINRRGGISGEQGMQHTEVLVRRNGQIILTAPYSQLLAGGDIAIQKGDEIVVRPNTQTFTAAGAVKTAGNYPISRPGMTLAEAMGASFGLADERSHKYGVFVFRLAEDQTAPAERSKIFRLDFNQAYSILVAQQFGIRPRDVLFVANAPLHEYNKVMTTFYRTIVTYRVVKEVIPAVGIF